MPRLMHSLFILLSFSVIPVVEEALISKLGTTEAAFYKVINKVGTESPQEDCLTFWPQEFQPQKSNKNWG